MSKVGDDSVEDFAEMAAHLRGKIEVVRYDVATVLSSSQTQRQQSSGTVYFLSCKTDDNFNAKFKGKK